MGIKTFKKNKNSWKYNFIAELDNGVVISYITIVTEYGKEFATECYRKTLEDELERFGGSWFSFYLDSKELVKE